MQRYKWLISPHVKLNDLLSPHSITQAVFFSLILNFNSIFILRIFMFDFLGSQVIGMFIFAIAIGLFMLAIDLFFSRFHPKNAIATFLLGVISALLFIICVILYESSPLEKRLDDAIENSKIYGNGND